MHPINIHLQYAVPADAFPQSHPTKLSFCCDPTKEKAPLGIVVSPKYISNIKKRLKYTHFGVYQIPNIFTFRKRSIFFFFLTVISRKGKRTCEDCLRNLKLLRKSCQRCQPKDYNGLTSQDFILLRYVFVHS